MDLIPYVRRPAASLGQPKRVLVTRLPTPQGEVLYQGHTKLDPAKFERDYSPEVIDDHEDA